MIDSKVHPIQMEVVGHSFISIAEEMSATLQRTAYSSIVREALDFSTAVFDGEGNLIAQSDNIPTHLGSMGGTLKQILAHHYRKEEIFEGDQLIINHPYMGASHTPDMLLFAPVFIDDTLVGFCGSMCHHVDVGGSAPGSAPGDATELYQEGLLIPPLKLYEKGEENKTITSIIKANVRMPDYTLGDLRSQISANEIGKKRMFNLYKKYSTEVVEQIIKAWADYSEERIRKKIKEIKVGTYSASGHLDDDGVVKNQPIKLEAKITIEPDKIVYDFTGCSEQVKGPFNVTKETVNAVAYFVTRCITDASVPQNEGAFKAVEVKLKKGTILNPAFPAPVSGRYHTIMRLSDICLEALSQALPDLIPAASNAHATTVAIGGRNPRTEDYFVYFELNGGGMGARPTKDGLSGIDVHVGNCMNVPIESAELEYPIRFQKYELHQDSGGMGEYRGGLGITREIKMLEDHLTLTVRGDAETTEPKGYHGGLNGRPAQKILNPGTKEERRLYGKATGLAVNKGDILYFETPGSGGYGSPSNRSVEKAVMDWKDGYISKNSLKEVYNIHVDDKKK
ncbi:hydantoinase B/oxoprolinase family protein [Salibacterium aidingense]|uniref:hydantoinase B/oxoprolinase family protein n=1 Tax=Salibacterium aidingense TaxID=384933 RepID=UPI003BE21736